MLYIFQAAWDKATLVAPGRPESQLSDTQGILNDYMSEPMYLNSRSSEDRSDSGFNSSGSSGGSVVDSVVDSAPIPADSADVVRSGCTRQQTTSTVTLSACSLIQGVEECRSSEVPQSSTPDKPTSDKPTPIKRTSYVYRSIRRLKKYKQNKQKTSQQLAHLPAVQRKRRNNCRPYGSQRMTHKNVTPIHGPMSMDASAQPIFPRTPLKSEYTSSQRIDLKEAKNRKSPGNCKDICRRRTLDDQYIGYASTSTIGSTASCMDDSSIQLDSKCYSIDEGNIREPCIGKDASITVSSASIINHPDFQGQGNHNGSALSDNTIFMEQDLCKLPVTFKERRPSLLKRLKMYSRRKSTTVV